MGQLSQNFHLQRCEPAAAHGAIDLQPAFGVRSRMPVSAEIEGDGEFSTPGISFDDFFRMNTFARKTGGERRLPTPSWAVNTSELRTLLIRFLERRAQIRTPGTGSEIQRLKIAQRVLLSRIPAMVETIDRLSREYMAVKDTDPTRAKMLVRQLSNLDTCIRMARIGPGGVARMVHLYYGCGMDSVGVASEIGITPMHVRQTLWRLHRVAKPETRRCACGNELAPHQFKCDVCKVLPRPAKIRHCACGAVLEKLRRVCNACKAVSSRCAARQHRREENQRQTT